MPTKVYWHKRKSTCRQATSVPAKQSSGAVHTGGKGEDAGRRDVTSAQAWVVEGVLVAGKRRQFKLGPTPC